MQVSIKLEFDEIEYLKETFKYYWPILKLVIDKDK